VGLTIGRSHLAFIEPGVKIIGTYYHKALLAQHRLPVIRNRNMALEGQFIFQQNSEPEKPLKY